MSRIQRHYERQFRRLGAQMQPPASADELFHRARTIALKRSISSVFATALLHAHLRHLEGRSHSFPRCFVCDAGLGGLARWLRAAGYDAFWNPCLDDAEVIRETDGRSATLITTDSLMMERGVLRDDIVPSVFVPSSLKCEEQLVVVMAELGLPLLEPRCMHCGGELRRVEKAAVIDRIPPKTALWLDEYFLCVRCNRLFWRGTHWGRIIGKLRALAAISPESSLR